MMMFEKKTMSKEKKHTYGDICLLNLFPSLYLHKHRKPFITKKVKIYFISEDK